MLSGIYSAVPDTRPRDKQVAIIETRRQKVKTVAAYAQNILERLSLSFVLLATKRAGFFLRHVDWLHIQSQLLAEGRHLPFLFFSPKAFNSKDSPKVD